MIGAINGHLSLESQNWQKKLTILGSGGVRNSLDIVKGLALGAKSMGVAGTILASLMSKKWFRKYLSPCTAMARRSENALYSFRKKDDRRIDEYRTCPRSSFS